LEDNNLFLGGQNVGFEAFQPPREFLAGHGRALALAFTNVQAVGKGLRTRAAIIVSARDMPGCNAGSGTSSGSRKPSRAARRRCMSSAIS
jgi:hypothetical protein